MHFGRMNHQFENRFWPIREPKIFVGQIDFDIWSKLVTQFWNRWPIFCPCSVFGMWNHRNSILFHSGKIDELNGLGKVKLAIAREHTIGLGSLDPSFAPYFRISQQSFSTMKSIALCRWFSLIRQAREEKGYLYADEFVTSLPLRTWVGLSKIQPNSSPHPQQNRRRTTHVPLHFTRTGYNE